MATSIPERVSWTASDDLLVLGDVALSAGGSLLVRLVNKTGSASVKGMVVRADTTTDQAFVVAPANHDQPLGAVYEAGVADGEPCWVAVSGIVQVLLKDTTAATRGNWVYMSSTQGRADATSATPVGVTEHTRELGHCVQTVGSGTDVLAKIVMHFN